MVVALIVSVYCLHKIVIECFLVVIITMEYPTCHLYFLGIHSRLKACMYEENTGDLWDI